MEDLLVRTRPLEGRQVTEDLLKVLRKPLAFRNEDPLAFADERLLHERGLDLALAQRLNRAGVLLLVRRDLLQRCPQAHTRFLKYCP